MRQVLRSKRAMVLTVLVGLFAALTFSSVALGVFATSQGVLADSNTVNAVNFNVDPIKLRTKDSVRIRVVHSVRPDGTVFGWHTHPGPAIVTVVRGGFWITQGSCTPTMVPAGGAYIEEPGVPVEAVTVGETEWITTMILPLGADPAPPTSPAC
jgi:quercetin dioxygenase-like cupin family protein